MAWEHTSGITAPSKNINYFLIKTTGELISQFTGKNYIRR
jgi:hypothetical protein